MPLPVGSGLLARALRGVTHYRVATMVAFCAIYGAMLAGDPISGGAPRSLAMYLSGVTSAATHFVPIFLAVVVVAEFAPRPLLQRALVLGVAVALGVVLGDVAASCARLLLGEWSTAARQHGALLLPLAFTGWLGLAIYLLHERDQAVAQSLHEEAERKLDLERQASEARLQVLQSQIEPHFLFNSLAHVRRLYRTNPGAGRAMMGHLSRYMIAALPTMREEAIALGRDLDLAAAYLNVQQVRMGARLEFEIDVPANLRQALVPPMTITTLVENAVKHGLSPLPLGGHVRIDARPDAGMLRIRISDTGRGFRESLGSGVGLANIRARLASLYGSAGKLALSRNTPQGVTATIVIPTGLAPAASG